MSCVKLVALCALSTSTASARRHARWADQYVRRQVDPRVVAKQQTARRNLMTVTPIEGSVYEVNGQLVNYSFMDCPPEWLDLLDAPAGCLPYSAAVSGPETQTGNFKTPMGVSLVETDNGVYGYAAPDPFGAGPLCEAFIDPCKFSEGETRKYPATSLRSGGKYPRGEFFEFDYPDGKCTKENSATQWLDCQIPCPKPFPMYYESQDGDPFAKYIGTDEIARTYGVAVMVFLGLSACIGIVALIRVRDTSKASGQENFYVAGRSLPLFVVITTLGSQSLDSNAAIGNLDLGYTYHWWDGAVLPIGLGMSLIINAIFFARKLNDMCLMTLPDLFARKFGKLAEVVFSILAIASFLCLLAGNLVGAGKIIAYCFGIDEIPGIWITCAAIWTYTVTGGLFSVAYTDVVQAAFGWVGMFVTSIYVIHNFPRAPGISPAYPLGDEPVIPEGMSDADAYDPIPNAIVLNWATAIVLAFGNLCALDFQARVFAARTPTSAQIGCFVAGFITWLVGILFSFMSGSIRALYGPSSPHAEFVADSCSRYITVLGCFEGESCDGRPLQGVPTCGEWKPDPYAPLKMLTCSYDNTCNEYVDFEGGGEVSFHPIPGFLGGWVLIAIIAASMSTGDGAILAMSTVLSHNLMRKLCKIDKIMLHITRASTLLWAVVAGAIASSVPGETGYLLIVAFDILLAGGVVPLFAAVYWKNCKPIAGVIAMIGGSLCRLILEFALPKDGLYLLVGTYRVTFAAGIYNLTVLDAFLGASTEDEFNEACPQRYLEDWTGADSLISPGVSLLLLIVCQLLPNPSHGWFQPVPMKETIESAVDGPEADAKAQEGTHPAEDDSKYSDVQAAPKSTTATVAEPYSSA